MSPNPATPDSRPEFADFRGLKALFCIPRTTALELAKEKEIRLVYLRRRGRVKCRCLVDLDSVRAYLKRCAEAA